MFRTSSVHHQERFVQSVFADLVCGNAACTVSTYVSSTCFGPHRSIIRSVLYKVYLRTLVCGTTVRTAGHVQLDVSSSTRITTYQSLQVQLVQNVPDDGPMRSETCRANISAE